MKGVGAFSNANHLLVPREERRYRQENRYDTNDTTLKVLAGDLKGADRRLILWAKNTGAWMTIRSTVVIGTVFPATEFRNFLCTSYNDTPSTSIATGVYMVPPSRYVTH